MFTVFEKQFVNHKLRIDYVKLNSHVKISFLLNFLKINSLEIPKSSLNRKTHLQNLVKEFLADLKLNGLLIIFCLRDEELYPLPINLKIFKRTFVAAFYNFTQTDPSKIRSLHSIAKLKYLKPESFQLTHWSLQSFLGEKDFPAFFDKANVSKFCTQFNHADYEPILKFSKKSLEKSKDLKSEPKAPEKPKKSEKPQNQENFDNLSTESSVSLFEEQSSFITEFSESVINLDITEKVEPDINSQAAFQQKIDIEKKKSSNSTKTEISDSIMSAPPKLNLQTWTSLEQDGCANEWLKNSIFLVNLNAKDATDATKMSLILNAIKNTDLKSKLITDLECLEDKEQTLVKLKSLVEKNTQKDEVTYRNLLKNLKYDPEVPMAELYSKVLRLVSKSMSLDMTTDKNSIEKLAISWFLEKIPRAVKSQMQDASFEDGEKLVESAEKIRSFQKLFLGEDDKQINAIKKSDTEKTSGNLKSSDNQTAKSKDTNNFEHNNRNNRNNNRYDNNRNNYQNNRNGGQRDNTYRDNNYRDNNYRDNSYRDNGRRDYGSRDNRYNNGNRYSNNNHGFNNNSRNNYHQNSSYSQNSNYRNQHHSQNYGNNRQNNGNNDGNNNYHGNYRITCEFCGAIGHTWQNCRTLKGMISRGKISPNWEPPKAIESNPNGGRASETGQAGQTGNPLFQ